MTQQRQGRILIVDDLPQWREELSEMLILEGFLVDTAGTIEQAVSKLRQEFYHLLLLDLRMDASDASNYEGIKVLKMQGQFSLNKALQIVILSAHGTIEHVREAFHDYQIADFLPKNKFSPETLLKCVRDTFTQKVKINLALGIHWEPPEAEERMLEHIELDGERIRPGTPRYQRIRAELDDLLCRLFHTATNILIEPLIPGYSGTGVVRIQPFYSNGGGRMVVTKFGASPKIANESHNFDAFVRPFVGGGRNTTLQEIRYTPLLGGIVYSLLGAANEQLDDFGSFYERARIDDICQVLDNLFFDTCQSWYANRGNQQLLDLTSDYQHTFGPISHPLEEKLDGDMVAHGERFTLSFLNDEDRTFTNPLPAMNRSFKRSTYLCTTHGDLNHHNMLIDKENYTWLIDFQGTGQGHYLRDLAMLDSVVRFQLLSPNEASLKECLRMEEALCSVTRFSELEQIRDSFQTDNATLRKAFLTAIHLRLIARQLVGGQSTHDMTEYYIALLHNALRTLTFNSLKPRQRNHALVSASLLIDKIDNRKAP